MCVCAQSLSPVQLSATLWTLGGQAPLSMGLSRQEYWSALPFLSLGRWILYHRITWETLAYYNLITSENWYWK